MPDRLSNPFHMACRLCCTGYAAPQFLIGRTSYLSPAPNDRSLGDRLIAVRYYDTHEITLFDVHTGHPYAQCWDPEWKLDTAVIEDGEKLASYSGSRTIRILNIVSLAAKHRNVVPTFMDMSLSHKAWMMDGWWVRIMTYCSESHSSTGNF